MYNQEVLDYEANNLGGGTKIFKVKCKSKGYVLNVGQCVQIKCQNLGILQELRKRTRRKLGKLEFKILRGLYQSLDTKEGENVYTKKTNYLNMHNLVNLNL